MKTRDLTFISIMLAVGVVLKLVTDVIFRTFLFMFFIDPLILIDVYLLIKYPKFKVALSVAAVQTLLSATLFMNTDMWFVRPFIVLIAFVIVKLFSKKKQITETKKYMFSCFFTSMFTIFLVCLILIGVILFVPDFFPMAEVQSQMASMSQDMPLNAEQRDLINNSLEELMIISLSITAIIFSLIPATIHMLLAFIISKTVKSHKKKQKLIK